MRFETGYRRWLGFLSFLSLESFPKQSCVAPKSRELLARDAAFFISGKKFVTFVTISGYILGYTTQTLAELCKSANLLRALLSS